MELQNNHGNPQKNLQFLCLITAGIVIFPFMILPMILPSFYFYQMEEYMAVPMLLFLGVTLGQRLSPLAKKCLLLSGMMVFWYVLVQTNHLQNHMGAKTFASFAVVYLLAFPYAVATEDGKEHRGLKWIGAFYVAYSVLMVIFGGMLLLDVVPETLAASVMWDGARASIFAHPNGGAFILLLGIGFTLYFLVKAQKKWAKAIFTVLVVLQICVQILTNSRTSILLTCALLGGTLFFFLWNGTWKRFLVGIAAALTVIVVLFSLTGSLFKMHSDYQIQKILEQGEQGESQQIVFDEETGEYSLSGSDQSVQGDLQKDMKTLNGRTWIWLCAFESLQDNPTIKIWGTEYAAAEISYRLNFGVVNAHNAWVQILMEEGIPGLLLALVYTLVAFWNMWKLVWRKDEDLSKKIVAMITLCILLASVLEVYIFATGMDSVFSNFVFFLCLGYLIQWNADAKAKA